MPQVIRVRDVERKNIHELPPDQPALRVPYDLFHPSGSVRRRGGIVDWLEAGVLKNARVAPAVLGDTHAGERVLLKLTPGGPDDEWWLFEVEAVDGIAAETSGSPGTKAGGDRA